MVEITYTAKNLQKLMILLHALQPTSRSVPVITIRWDIPSGPTGEILLL